jgi:prepilin-type N-terminal cleavage/methylation domain-containing protein
MKIQSDRWQVAGDKKSRASSCHASLVTRHAFTLIELLVVISIMGILAALTVPALKNLGKSNAQVSASRQLLDDIGHARQLAIAQHTTVYMVFVPTNFFNMANYYGHTVVADLNNGSLFSSAADQLAALTTLTNLVDKQLTGYNFISLGKVGDQPGNHNWHYLDDWKSLPDGTFIAAAKFLPQNYSFQIPAWQNDYPNAGQIDNWLYLPPLENQIYGFAQRPIPFPTEQSPLVWMPCLAFDHTGRLISETTGNGSYHHAYIPLAQGTVSFGHDANKQPILTPLGANDITETPPGNSSSISYNVIDIDPLSGRAKLLVHKIP